MYENSAFYPHGWEHVLILSTDKSPLTLPYTKDFKAKIQELAKSIKATSMQSTSILYKDELSFLRSFLEGTGGNAPQHNINQIIGEIYSESHGIFKHLKAEDKNILYYIGFTCGDNANPTLLSKEEGLDKLLLVFNLEQDEIFERIYDKRFERGFHYDESPVLLDKSDNDPNYIMIDIKVKDKYRSFLNSKPFMSYGIMDLMLKNQGVPLRNENGCDFNRLFKMMQKSNLKWKKDTHATTKSFNIVEFKDFDGKPDGYTGLSILGHNRKISWHSYPSFGGIMIDLRTDTSFDPDDIKKGLKDISEIVSYQGLRLPY